MKKLALSILVIIVAATSIFASEANVNLKTSIKEAPLEYNLYRKTDNSLTLIEDGETYTVDNLNPLSTNTMITDFTIRVNSNSNSSKSVKVKVTPHTFKTTLNGNREFDSKVKPVVNTIIDKGIVEAGLNQNKEVYRFNIFISGRPNLPAGKYTSIVDVEYVVQ